MHFAIIIVLPVLILIAVSSSTHERGDMAARLGTTLYWIGCLAAAGWAAVVLMTGMLSTDDGFWLLVIPTLLLWAAGYACRYVLAGKQP